MSSVVGVGGPPRPLGFQIRRTIKANSMNVIMAIMTYIIMQRESGERLLRPNDKEIRAKPRKPSIIIAAPKVSRTASARTLTEAAVDSQIK
jgi:hypothetical protein